MVKIDYKKVNIYCLCHIKKDGKEIRVKFLPGLNELEDEIFDSIKENKFFKIRVERGDFVIISNVKSTSNAIKEKPRLGELLEDIKNTYNYEKLIEIKETDDRKTVKDAVEAQIQRITPTEEDHRNKKGKGIKKKDGGDN